MDYYDETLRRVAERLRGQSEFLEKQGTEIEHFLRTKHPTFYEWRESRYDQGPVSGIPIEPKTSVHRFDFEDEHSMNAFATNNLDGAQILSRSFTPSTGMYHLVVRLKQPYSGV